MKRGRAAWMWVALGVLPWIAHALGYLVHEYGHSFTAWALGWKENPLAIEYGHWNWRNVLLLNDMDENVDYPAIIAAGKDHLAGAIAAAGLVLGSGAFYLAAREFYSAARRRKRQMPGLFAFLLCLMNVGNFWDYVPVRTFATHADMANMERGLGISPWWVVVVLGLPSAVAVWHFLERMLPDARELAFPGSGVYQKSVTVLSTFTLFVFFGSSGMRGYGPVSHWISVVSVCVVFPLATVLCWPRKVVRSAKLEVETVA